MAFMLPKPAPPNVEVKLLDGADGLLGCKAIIPIDEEFEDVLAGCKGANADNVLGLGLDAAAMGFMAYMLLSEPMELFVVCVVGLGVLHSNLGFSACTFWVCTEGVALLPEAAAEGVGVDQPQSLDTLTLDVSCFPRTSFSKSISPAGVPDRAPGRPPKERKSSELPVGPLEACNSLNFWVCSCSILSDKDLIVDMKDWNFPLLVAMLPIIRFRVTYLFQVEQRTETHVPKDWKNVHGNNLSIAHPPNLFEHIQSCHLVLCQSLGFPTRIGLLP